jgi:bacillithiol biosynthesis cysteine-adding enzyme BshC
MKTLINPSLALGYSKLSMDYLANKKNAREFFSTQSAEQALNLLDNKNYRRAEIVQILTEQNKRYKSSSLTFDNIRLLGHTDTLCVMAGHQPILFGGPLYILIKAIALAKQANKLSKELSRVVVPIFWIDGDDHDFTEANHTYLLDHQGEIVPIFYDDETTSSQQLGEHFLTQEKLLNQAKKLFYESIGKTEFTPYLKKLIESAYQIDKSMTDAFGILMAQLTAKYGIIYFCPTDLYFKQQASQFFENIIHLQYNIHQKELAVTARISQADYPIQVQKKPNSVHLFYSGNGNREPIHSDDKSFSTINKTWTYDELIHEIKKKPHYFSTDVITRSLLQSHIFPVICYIAGPSELAYQAQINPLFVLFDLASPFYILRPSVTFIESRFQKMMQNYKIVFNDLLGDIEIVINRVLATSFPENLTDEWKEAVEKINQSVERFLKKSLYFDEELKRFTQLTEHKIEEALGLFEKKIFSSHKKKQQLTRDRIYRLQKTLCMYKIPQERNLNVFYFLARYGSYFIDDILESVELDCKGHQIINFGTKS